MQTQLPFNNVYFQSTHDARVPAITKLRMQLPPNTDQLLPITTIITITITIITTIIIITIIVIIIIIEKLLGHK